MNMNDAKKTMFCPLEEDVVDAESCRDCGLWDGRRCCYGHDMKATGKVLKWYRSLHGRVFGLRRRFRRGGRRLIVPPVWEKWARAEPEAEERAITDENTEYGTAEIAAAEQQVVHEEEDEFILPELIKEYWDVEPDVPDWIPEEGESPLPGPGVPEAPLPEDIEPKPISPVPGTEPGIGIPPVGPPDLTPEIPGPPVP